MIKCEFYKNGKCTDTESLLSSMSVCEHCPMGKPADTCCLLCDCEEETCNIGEIIDDQ